MKLKTILRCVVILLVVSVLLTPQVAAAQENSFEFAETEASFSWKEVQDGKAKIEILNNDTSDLSVAFSISGIDFIEIAPIAGDPSLPAGAALEINLAAAEGADPEPETYTGYLNASLPASKTTKHLPLTITVADESEDKITPTPISDTWEVKHVMPVLFWDKALSGQYKNGYLPIETGDGQPCDKDSISPAPDAALGTLVLPGKDTAEVIWSGEVARLDDGNCALELAFVGLDRPGEYSGTIDLLPADKDNGDVTLKVTATHSVVWPILAIVLGVLVSTFVLNKLNVNRPILILLLDEADTENVNDGNKAKEKYKGYVIADAEKQRNLIRKEINRIKKEYRWKVNEVLDKNNEEYQSVIDSLKALDEKVNAWNNEFPDNLKNLEEQLQRIVNGEKPRFYDSVKKLLSGCELCFGKPDSAARQSFTEQHQKIKKASLFFESWIEWKKALDIELKRFQEIDKTTLDPAYIKNYENIRLELSELQGILCDTDDFEAFDSQVIEDALDQVNHSLGGLIHIGEIKPPEDWTTLYPVPLKADIYPYDEDRRTGQFGPIVLLSRGGYTPSRGAIDFAAIRDRIRKLGERAAKDLAPSSEEDLAKKREKRILTLERILHHSDVVMIIISAVGGIYGGLQAHYFGQPFGTALDYIAVFMWGLGAKATVEGIWAAINRLVVKTG